MLVMKLWYGIEQAVKAHELDVYVADRLDYHDVPGLRERLNGRYRFQAARGESAPHFQNELQGDIAKEQADDAEDQDPLYLNHVRLPNRPYQQH